ncbi:MAG: hypothetical protein IJW26_00165 [Clostridia bacterium]|nr:hypothetical protein [Clostridia bacterium]
MKVLILTCSTGEGHNSAAKAISHALNIKGIKNDVFDPISLSSEKIRDGVAGAYNGMIRKTPWLFGFIYNVGGLYEKTRLPCPVDFLNRKYAKNLSDYIQENGYDRVICTHLFPMFAMGEVNRRYKKVPSFCVLTDYTVIPFLSLTELDGYFVPTADQKKILAKKGIDQEKIFVSGIPTDPDFEKDLDKTDAKIRLGLNPDLKYISLLSGGAGCGKIVKICSLFSKKLPDGYAICVFYGKNQKLCKKLQKKFSSCNKIIPIGFTNQIAKYLKASEVALSKPGGLSSTEIAVSKTPFVHLKAIPGCESKNIKYFTENGLSLKGTSPKKAVEKTLFLINDKVKADSIVENQSRTILSRASYHIIEKVLGVTNDN